MGNLHIISRNKIAFCLILAFGIPVLSHSQTRNLERFDYGRKIHFGFTLGTNISNFKYEFSPKFYEYKDLLTIKVHQYPGITLAAISDLHFGEFFDLRGLPSLVLAERRITYNFVQNNSVTKSVESVFFELPLLVKFKSLRHENLRFYVIGGGKFSYDFSSDAKAMRDPDNPIVAIKPVSLAYEFGCGLDMYFYFFKFSPEIKMSKGINNILDPYDDVYSNIFKKLFSNFIFISFHFEG